MDLNGLTEIINEQNNENHYCTYCHETFQKPGDLNTHQVNCRTKKEQDIVNTYTNQSANNSKKPLKRNNNDNICRTCGLQFKYKKVLQRHEAMHNGEFSFWCKLCPQSFATREERTTHKLQDHPEQKIKKYACKLCSDLQFENEAQYLLHVSEAHKGRANDYFICSECGKQFKTKSELTQHNRSKCSTVKQFKCKICGQDLMTPGSLYNHMRRHTGELACMCVYCGKQFVTLGQLQVHVRIHTQDKAFKCEVCGKGFCHRQSLITHSTIHTGVKPYQCENCSKSFSCVGNLLKHRRTHSDSCGLIPLTTHRVLNPNTKIKVQINTPDSSKLKTFNKKKEIEEKVAAYRKSLEVTQKNVQDTKNAIIKNEDERLHVGTSENDSLTFNTGDSKETLPELKLEEIHIEDNTYDSFKEHVPKVKLKTQRRKLRNTNTEDIKTVLQEQDPSEVKCEYCEKSYTNVRWLKKHERQHIIKDDNFTTDDQSYRCSCCKMGFNTKEECKIHQRNIHSSVLTCEDCDKMFSNVDSLRSHQNIFHKGLPRKIYTYICQKCGFQFRQKAALFHHEQSNCGTGPIYPCNICGKTFNSVYTQKTHLSVHDPKKTFLCKFCGKSFRWKGQLKIHERSHTGEKPFKCLYCPKAFAYRESLLTHSSLHTGIKPHLCQACGSRFSCIGNLIKHRITHATTCGAWYSKNQGT